MVSDVSLEQMCPPRQSSQLFPPVFLQREDLRLNRTKRAHFRGNPLFQAQQKTVKPTYLLSVRCQEAGGRKRARDCLDEKRTIIIKLFKKRSFNLLCVLDLFSERWQSALFQIFFFFFAAEHFMAQSEIAQCFGVQFFSSLSPYFLFLFPFGNPDCQVPSQYFV